MTLLSLPELLVQFGTPIYRIDHVNGTLHATYSRGIKCVPLKSRINPTSKGNSLSETVTDPLPQPQATSTPALVPIAPTLSRSITNKGTLGAAPWEVGGPHPILSLCPPAEIVI